MLWQHVSFWPVGNWTAAGVSSDGIQVEGEMPLFAKGRVLRERIEEAWESVKLGLVRGLSIGFRPLDYTWDKDSEGFLFKEWEWLETSLVTIPANAEATIQVVRACDLAANKPALGLAGEAVRMDSATLARVRAARDRRSALERAGAFFRK
jgi:HK97 family phage prohead protease